MRQKTKDEIRELMAKEVKQAVALAEVERAARDITKKVREATARLGTYPLSDSYGSRHFGYVETPADRLATLKRAQSEREERAAADIAGFESLDDYRSWLTLEELRKATLAAPKKPRPADPLEVKVTGPLGPVRKFPPYSY